MNEVTKSNASNSSLNHRDGGARSYHQSVLTGAGRIEIIASAKKQAPRSKHPAGRYALLTSDLAESTARETTKLGALYCPKPMTTPQADRIVRHCLEP